MSQIATRAWPIGQERGEGRWWDSALPVVLLVLFLLYTFVGVSPMGQASVDARVEGNDADRIATFALAGLSVGVMALRARTTLRLIGRTWLCWAMVGWITASVLWSDYPDLTLRRAVSMDLITLVCLALAVGCRNLRQFHTVLVFALAAIVVANLVVLALRPDIAITDIGVRGMFSQKNQAGLFGMLAVIVSLCWTVDRRGPLAIVAGLGATGMAFVFLVLTDSKTSIALTLVACLALPLLTAVRRIGKARTGLLLCLAGAVLVAAALFFAASDGDWAKLVSGGGDGSFTGRTQIWGFALHEIGRRPWLGAGYGAFWDVGAENDPLLRAPPGEWLSQVKIGVINQAHDGFLDLLLQGGIPALALALAIWAQAMRRLTGLLFTSDDGSGLRIASMMFLVIMGVLLFHNITETSIWARGQMLASINILITCLAARFTPDPADIDERSDT